MNFPKLNRFWKTFLNFTVTFLIIGISGLGIFKSLYKIFTCLWTPWFIPMRLRLLCHVLRKVRLTKISFIDIELIKFNRGHTQKFSGGWAIFCLHVVSTDMGIVELFVCTVLYIIMIIEVR